MHNSCVCIPTYVHVYNWIHLNYVYTYVHVYAHMHINTNIKYTTYTVHVQNNNTQTSPYRYVHVDTVDMYMCMLYVVLIKCVIHVHILIITWGQTYTFTWRNYWSTDISTYILSYQTGSSAFLFLIIWHNRTGIRTSIFGLLAVRWQSFFSNVQLWQSSSGKVVIETLQKNFAILLQEVQNTSPIPSFGAVTMTFKDHITHL